MNIVVISGRLAQNAVAFGKEKETLKFTVACAAGYDNAAPENKADFVPCVIFRAPPKLRDLLIASGKGKPVELRGKVITGSYEQNGVTRYATEVVVEQRDFHLLRTGGGSADPREEAGDRDSLPPQRGDPAYGSYPQRQPSGGRIFSRPESLGYE